MDNNDEDAMKMLTVGTEILAEKEFELRHQQHYVNMWSIFCLYQHSDIG